MALLKKIKASTLIETMVATVLIIIIFTMASMILNSIFASTLERNTSGISERLWRLEYEFKNGLIKIPHYGNWDAWEVEILKENNSNSQVLILQATHRTTDKTIKTYAIIEE